MLTSVELTNIRSWVDATVPLSPFCVLVGPNGSGKTTVLEAIAVASTSLEAVVRGADLPDVRHLLRNGANSLRIALNASEPNEMLEVRLTPDAANGTDSTYLRFQGPGLRYESSSPSNLHNEIARETAQRWRTRLLRLQASQLAANSYSEQLVPGMGVDGENLSSVLGYLKLEAAGVFSSIENDLRLVIPALRAIKVVRAPVVRNEMRTVTVDGSPSTFPDAKRYMGFGFSFDMEGVGEVASSSAGEGTLYALGLITDLHARMAKGPTVIDDVELRLHPAAQAKLVGQLRVWISRGHQVIATTHSPFFVQHLQAGEVVAVHCEGGVSSAKLLSDHPDYARWKDTMGVGEFWSSVGEAWLRRTG
jgi:predicted ATPase